MQARGSGTKYQMVDKSRISNAAEIGRWLGNKQPMTNRLEYLLEEYEQRQHSLSTTNSQTSIDEKKLISIKQVLLDDGKEVILSADDKAGLMVLAQFYWLLSQYNGRRTDNIHSIINPTTHSMTASSPIDRLKDHLTQLGIVDLSGSEFGFVTKTNTTPIPPIDILDLIQFAEEIQSKVNEHNAAKSDLNKHLLEQHYISTGSEDGDFYDYDDASSGNHYTISDEYAMLSGGATDDFFVDEEEQQAFAKYLTEISSTQGESSTKDDENMQFESSLVDALAVDAQSNISVMKSDVDQALSETGSAQTHLVNYKEFIEKKRKQRIQCLRDMQIHCCTCRGPHISNPPFSHGKDYRREPTHPQHQGSACLFLKKKRSELKWLDDTLDAYSRNKQRFELEIEQRKIEVQRRKGELTELLTNSLRLMEIVSDD